MSRDTPRNATTSWSPIRYVLTTFSILRVVAGSADMSFRSRFAGRFPAHRIAIVQVPGDDPIAARHDGFAFLQAGEDLDEIFALDAGLHLTRARRVFFDDVDERHIVI